MAFHINELRGRPQLSNSVRQLWQWCSGARESSGLEHQLATAKTLAKMEAEQTSNNEDAFLFGNIVLHEYYCI